MQNILLGLRVISEVPVWAPSGIGFLHWSVWSMYSSYEVDVDNAIDRYI